MMQERLLRFDYIPYPLWRRRWPAGLSRLLAPLWERWYPVGADAEPPRDLAAMADVMLRFGLMPDADLQSIYAALNASDAHVEDARGKPAPVNGAVQEPVRVPAQWEPHESILLNWPVMYPPLWSLHAEMVEGIAPVAEAVITVPSPPWAHAAWLFLQAHGLPDNLKGRVRFLVIPTDDIWVRDHGPIVGLDGGGEQVAFNAIYDHLPHYPQERDDTMPRYWASHTETPLYSLALHTEGGNFISDGAGTLLMTEQVFRENPAHTRESLEAYLHSVFQFDKLIVTPYLNLEPTGHIDLLLKLADAETVLISSVNGKVGSPLAALRTQLGAETNAAGQPYTLFELPTPPIYFNWLAFPVRRSYTNALTVNGRVLVPTYGIPQDETALRTYEAAMPGYTILPIDCRVGINGNGAVHCMTKEIPARRNGC